MTETTRAARPLLIVKDLAQFADENGHLVWTKELIESFMQFSDFAKPTKQRGDVFNALVFKSIEFPEQQGYSEAWRDFTWSLKATMPVGLSNPTTNSGINYGPSYKLGYNGSVHFVGHSFFKKFGANTQGWSVLLRRTLGLRHRMHLTRGKTLEQWFADGEIFYPTNESNSYTEVVFLELRNGEPHIKRIPIHTKELPGVEYVSYRKGNLTRVEGTMSHDTDASNLEADLAAAASVTERRTNHFLYVVRDQDMIARVRQMFGHTDGCYDCNTLKTLAVMFSDHKVKLGHDARYESW